MMMLNGPQILPRHGGKPKQLVILLHGVGASGDDLIGLVPALAPTLPDAVFVSPNAPFGCETVPFGYQWFSLREWTPAMMFAGIQAAAPILQEFIDAKIKEYDLSAAQTALIGFSQGCMMALHAAPRQATALAGVIGLSGTLLGAEMLQQETRSKPPVLLGHGMLDTVVPYPAMSYAAMTLKQGGFNVETMTRPMLGHGIDDEELAQSAVFLKKNLKA
jgi:phospholipase/carboxylesterase